MTLSGAGGDVVLPISPLMAPMATLAAAAPARGRVLETAEELAEAIGRALGDELANAWRLRVAVLGEAIAGEASELAATTVPESATIDALSVVLASTGSGGAHRSGGAGGWQLTSPSSSTPALLRSERRDAHRRTRRGKQHRRLRGGEALVQPRLFADRK